MINQISILIAVCRRTSMDSKTFIDSPVPNFVKDQAKKRLNPGDCDSQWDEIDLIETLKYCKRMRLTVQSLTNNLNLIEEKCNNLLKKQAMLDGTMSGIRFLSESVELL